MPKIEYRNKEGEIIPSVTTIINNNLAWGKGALMGWAYNRGKEGKPLRDQDALDVGNIAHAMVEADIKGQEYRTPDVPREIIEKAENAFLAYLEWKGQVNFKLVKSELSLVSEKYQYGGTIDIVAEINSQLAIIDIKTSNDVYIDHKCQIVAYEQLYNENFQDKCISMLCILKLGKEDGSFSFHYFSDLSKEWEVFLLLLELEKLRRILKIR